MGIYPIFCKFAPKTKIHGLGFIGYKSGYPPYGTGCNKLLSCNPHQKEIKPTHLYK